MAMMAGQPGARGTAAFGSGPPGIASASRAGSRPAQALSGPHVTTVRPLPGMLASDETGDQNGEAAGGGGQGLRAPARTAWAQALACSPNSALQQHGAEPAPPPRGASVRPSIKWRGEQPFLCLCVRLCPHFEAHTTVPGTEPTL